MSAIDIEPADVARIVLQYLKENNLHQTYEMFTKESGVKMNIVDNLPMFLDDVRSGHWDTVLKTIQHVDIPDKALVNLYEQIVYELIDLKEFGAARSVLRQTNPMIRLKKKNSERYLRLESALGMGKIDPLIVYGDGTKEEKRAAIAEELSKVVSVAPQSRLLTLFQQSIKWQKHSGVLPEGASVDLFRGRAIITEKEEELPPTHIHKSIKLGGKTHSECALFSSDGQFFVTGSADGMIEIWNHRTAKIRKDLKFQQEGRFMFVDSMVLCLCFSADNEMLAVGTRKGKIRVFKAATGQVVRKMDRAHLEGVTSIAFTADNSRLLSTSFDGTVKLHGLRSGKALKEFRGHTSYVNTACFSADFSKVISGSSDGTVKIWDVKTERCLSTHSAFVPVSSAKDEKIAEQKLTVNKVLLNSTNNDEIIVCNRSNAVHVINFDGEVLRSFCNGLSSKRSEFVSVVESPSGQFLYCAAENKHIYCFNKTTAQIVGDLTMGDNTEDVIGLCHHPFQNYIATFSEGNTVDIWVP
eukprot:m.117740 g.117740  ORF g.117740 m.117740 type:complete len:525 (+) comp12880_c0_seq1:2544-4118(+)